MNLFSFKTSLDKDILEVSIPFCTPYVTLFVTKELYTQEKWWLFTMLLIYVNKSTQTHDSVHINPEVF